MAKSTGEIFELYNNYGSINSDSFKQGEETIPFEITRDMIVEKDGAELIRYTREVTFDLHRSDNVRDKQIREAVNVEFTGSEWLFKKRTPKKSYEETVAALFEKYCFANPCPDNFPALRRYLNEIGFRPRMLEYLMAQGIFLTRDHYKVLCNMPDSMLNDLRFDPRLLIAIDSELFDYVSLSEQVPIEDLMEQLDLSELPEFLKKLQEIATQHNLSSPDLDAIYASVSMITDLSVLRNAAAHGKSLIIGLMDPDFNANWDLTIDNPKSRGKVEDWELYALMYDFWGKRSLDEDRETINRIIATIFGNPYRRSWSELHYLYHTVIRLIDPEKWRQFSIESDAFLDYNEKEGSLENLSNVDLTSLNLPDMGPTTSWPLPGTPAPPYREIANEAMFVKEALDMRAKN